MSLIELLWGRNRSIRADMSVFWTLCSGIVLAMLSVAVLVVTWRYLLLDFGIDANEERFFITMAVCLFIGCAVSAAFGLVMALWLTHRYRRPLDAVAKAAQDIAHGNWSKRVEVKARSREVAMLISAFNAMCDSNEKVLAELRRAGDELSHDLKTPLTHMQMIAERIAKSSAIPHDQVAMLADAISSMRSTIDTVLDISRTEHRINIPVCSPVDLRKVAESVAEMYSAVAEERGISFGCTVPDAPALVFGNENSLGRVLANLLDNAFKFTPDGGSISMMVAITRTAVTLTVSDTGSGILPKDMPCIYNRFFRADASRRLPGHGLGLSLVKAIVESFGGTISAHSVPGVETVFTVSLPPCSLDSKH